MEYHGTTFTPFDLAMMPTDSNTLVCDNEFIVSDSINDDFDNDAATNLINQPRPFKLEFTMLLLCLSGTMRLNINLNDVEVTANDMLIILPGTIGESYMISSDCQVCMVAFSAPLTSEAPNLSFGSLYRKHPLLHLAPEEMQEMVELYKMMRRKIEQPGFSFTRNVLQCLIQVMFSNAASHLAALANSEAGQQPNSRVQMLFDKFIELVQANYSREREIQYYASQMCMTPKYLSRVVYQASGRYAGEWIRDYVILEAKTLLKSGRYNVQQVSIKLNFASASFFGKYFKKAVGCSPRKYAAG